MISRVSRATAMVTLMGVLFPDECLQLIHLHRPFPFLVRCGMLGRIGGDGSGVGGEPVGDSLLHDTKQSPDGALAHPFEIELDGLRLHRDATPPLLRGWGEVAPTGEAVVPMGALPTYGSCEATRNAGKRCSPYPASIAPLTAAPLATPSPLSLLTVAHARRSASS
jgi:hypothetical protein